MFVSDAYAQAAGSGMDFMGLGGLGQMLPIIVMFVLLYFLMIRPQMKRTKEHKTMLEGLQKGDEVVAAGLLGKIIKVGDSFASVEISPNVVIAVQKQSITQLMPKGTI